MKTMRKNMAVCLGVTVVAMTVFLVGRFGWKAAGFQACQQAGITSVEVTEDVVNMKGFNPGSFPEGFCGYYSEIHDGKLYVGFRFSAVFGFFETGDFDVTIPVSETISEVIVKSGVSERSVWDSSSSLSDGVYVRVEGSDVYCISISYEGVKQSESRIVE